MSGFGCLNQGTLRYFQELCPDAINLSKRYYMIRTISFSVLITCLFSLAVSAAEPAAQTDGKWERTDRVLAVVNNTPIIESDFNRRMETLSRGKNRAAVTQSKVLDICINEIILDQAAEFQAIQISQDRIDNDIKRIMDRFGITDKEVFKKRIEQDQGLSWEEFRREVRKQAITEQLMMVAIDYGSSSPKEEREWYEQNKNQLVEVRMRQIFVKPKGNGFAAEKAANERIKEIQRRLISGEAFDDLARKESEDPETAAKGGDMGWVMLAETDPYLANQVMQSFSPGGVSGVIKSSFGYHILKFYEKRLAPFSEVQGQIGNMLSNQRRTERFQRWIMDARKEAEIMIYLEGYKPPQG